MSAARGPAAADDAPVLDAPSLLTTPTVLDPALEGEAPAGSGSLRGAARSGIIWSAAEKWGTRLASFVVFLVLARLLAPRDFGTVASAAFILQISVLLIDAGFAKYVVQAKDLDQPLASTVFWLTCGTSAVLAAGIAGAAPALAGPFDNAAVVHVVQALALTILINAVGLVPMALLQRELAFRKLAVRRLVATLCSVVAGVSLAVAGAGVWALVAQSLVNSVVGSVMLWSTTTWRPSFTFVRRHAVTALAFGSGLIGIEAMGIVGRNADNVAIATTLGATQLGFYAVGFQMLIVLLDVLSSVTGALALPLFARLREDPVRLRSGFLTMVRIGSLGSFPVFSGLLVVAPALVPLLFGHKYDNSIGVMQWLAIAGLVQGLTFFDRPILIALGKVRLELVVTLCATVGNVIAILLAVPHGIVAVAAAVALRNVLFWPIRLWALSTIGIRPLDYARAILPALVASALSAVVALGVTRLLAEGEVLSVAMAVLAGGLVYLATLRLGWPSAVRSVVALARG